MKAQLSYVIDKHNVIVEVGGWWDEFALENGAPELISEKVVGRPLSAFITGDATQLLVNSLLELVRNGCSPVRIPYRCDAPGVRRYMEMTLERLAGRAVELRHSVSNTAPMRNKLHFVSGGARSFVKRCSSCNRLNAGGGWSEADAAVEAELVPPTGIIDVAYGVCPDCMSRLALPR